MQPPLLKRLFDTTIAYRPPSEMPMTRLAICLTRRCCNNSSKRAPRIVCNDACEPVLRTLFRNLYSGQQRGLVPNRLVGSWPSFGWPSDPNTTRSSFRRFRFRVVWCTMRGGKPCLRVAYRSRGGRVLSACGVPCEGESLVRVWCTVRSGVRRPSYMRPYLVREGRSPHCLF